MKTVALLTATCVCRSADIGVVPSESYDVGQCECLDRCGSSFDTAYTYDWSRRAAAGRAELLAKKGVSGRMQRLTELVPIPIDPYRSLAIPIWSVKAP